MTVTTAKVVAEHFIQNVGYYLSLRLQVRLGRQKNSTLNLYKTNELINKHFKTLIPLNSVKALL